MTGNRQSTKERPKARPQGRPRREKQALPYERVLIPPILQQIPNDLTECENQLSFSFILFIL